jgi:hypothetical protein
LKTIDDGNRKMSAHVRGTLQLFQQSHTMATRRELVQRNHNHSVFSGLRVLQRLDDGFHSPIAHLRQLLAKLRIEFDQLWQQRGFQRRDGRSDLFPLGGFKGNGDLVLKRYEALLFDRVYFVLLRSSRVCHFD